MNRFRYLLTLPALFLVGCAAQPVETTTTVTREVTTTTRPGMGEVVVAQAPPAVRIETRTAAPGPGYVWSTGHWRWTGTRYVWIGGSWIARPTPTAVWVEGHWIPRPGGSVWIEGHWQ